MKKKTLKAKYGIDFTTFINTLAGKFHGGYISTNGEKVKDYKFEKTKAEIINMNCLDCNIYLYNIESCGINDEKWGTGFEFYHHLFCKKCGEEFIVNLRHFQIYNGKTKFYIYNLQMSETDKLKLLKEELK
jgi:hypothetical protein